MHPLLKEFQRQSERDVNKVAGEPPLLDTYSEFLARRIVEESIKVIDGNPDSDKWADLLRAHFGLEKHNDGQS